MRGFAALETPMHSLRDSVFGDALGSTSTYREGLGEKST